MKTSDLDRLRANMLLLEEMVESMFRRAEAIVLAVREARRFVMSTLVQVGLGLFVLFLAIYAHFGVVIFVSRVLRFVLYVCLPTATLLLTPGVRFAKHPVHALLCLIAVFFNTVVIYLLAGSEFLAFVFLIVYVGAIAILFLFVIRLLNVKDLIAARRLSNDLLQR